MGLTLDSIGSNAIDNGLVIRKKNPNDKVIALAGNPNVGKSTVFNQLTGLNQHTGNWPGKTVTNAQGYCTHNNMEYVIVDLPGTYSLMAHSVEEEVARDFICFGGADAVIVVCDATSLERNLNLVLQTIEITDKVVLCVNLLDEAKKKNITVDLDKLSDILGIPVVGTSARSNQGLDRLMSAVEELTKTNVTLKPIQINYTTALEQAISILEPIIHEKLNYSFNARWISLKLIDYDEPLIKSLNEYLMYDILADESVSDAILKAREHLLNHGMNINKISDEIVSCIVKTTENTANSCVRFGKNNYNSMDRKIDRILTSKFTGIPVMISLLALVFWLTITGSNYPSQLISKALFWFQDRLIEMFIWIHCPVWLYEMLVLGVYRVLAWVVSVMLPPMAIFFPLFTLLEDVGYLPRVAFNLDKYFKKSCACGKQALTMCMGFGCNAAGVVGCRIIDSPRERLIAIITNNFVPCNGRFPTLIAIISMFFIGSAVGGFQSIVSMAILTLVIVIGVFMTLFVSKLLSKTILKGIPSSFILELPPYRKPQIGKVIIRSIFDRTLFVLGRAMMVAAPAGLVIYLMANISVGNASILAICSDFLNPFAHLIGMDGVILLAFILGFPANEIVVPIIIMAYMSTGSILELDSLSQLKELLTNNGWTWITAVSTMIFTLMHWPCSTTCLTIKKETQSLKWTVVSFLVPTVFGLVACFIFTTIARLF